jgi:hypothetical protein
VTPVWKSAATQGRARKCRRVTLSRGAGHRAGVRIKSPLTGHSPKPHLRGRRLRSGLPFFVVVAEKLQRIDDAEALLKSLRKTLTS